MEEKETLKISAEVHRRLKAMAAELGLKMGEMATAILDAQLKNGPKAVWKIMQQAENTPGHTSPEEPPRTETPSRTASATAKRRNAR